MTKHLLLVGNGSFRNHGCEAIARGTAHILRYAFGDSVIIEYAALDSREKCEAEISQLADDRIIPHSLYTRLQKLEKPWFEYHINRLTGSTYPGLFTHLQDTISGAEAVLSVGGDNYSLDYGYPERFLQLDRLILKNQRPLIYWCASVGKFTADKVFESRVRAHLQRIDAILVRESESARYLDSLGVSSNVRLVADPGFAMPASAPEPTKYRLTRERFVGVNYSTTVAQLLTRKGRNGSGSADSIAYVAQPLDAMAASGQYNHICELYADITIALIEQFDGNLVFVPHVTDGAHSDYDFMRDVAEYVEGRGYPKPLLVPPTLTAPEYKWVIAQSRLFLGARTHSTIAAYSSGVPTIALSYGLKATGLAKDFYETDEFCIDGDEINADVVRHKVETLVADETRYRDMTIQKAQESTERAFLAGEILAEMLASTW